MRHELRRVHRRAEQRQSRVRQDRRDDRRPGRLERYVAGRGSQAHSRGRLADVCISQGMVWSYVSVIRTGANRTISELGHMYHCQATTPHIWTSHRKVRNSVLSGPPSETRTPRKDRCAKDHNAPSHISKTVLSIVKFGGPKWIVGGTIFEMWLGLSSSPKCE